ncbi:kinetochore Sim4 complex subunit Fta4 [Xylariaceae sp. FL0662B]|nr:kinetochore Sim4 complex subunit Fta4 [Xylariaceae sp. FL0662B]
MPPPTILANKSAFLTAQTLLLSRELAPSNAWRNANERSEHALPDKAVGDAMYRVNHVLQQHARRVYAPQASRHVAEQIEGLYLDAAEKAMREEREGELEDEDEAADRGNGEAGRLRVGVDFATDTTIASLPPTWDLHRPGESEAYPLESRRYAELASSLTALSARRRDARERLERLRRMGDLLAPFTTPHNTVQPNLVTRNGEVEAELERMRVLLVRVAGRVAQLPDAEGGGNGGGDDDGDDNAIVQDMDVVERKKVERLLDNF